MNFQWLPITSLQSLFAEFVAALLQCLALEREAEGLASNRPIIRPPLNSTLRPNNLFLHGTGLFRRTVMRTFAMASMLLGILMLGTDAASAAPWCAQYGDRGGGTNCGFYSFDQCMAALWGGPLLDRPHDIQALSPWLNRVGSTRDARRSQKTVRWFGRLPAPTAFDNTARA
jgi:hypothetical protein